MKTRPTQRKRMYSHLAAELMKIVFSNLRTQHSFYLFCKLLLPQLEILYIYIYTYMNRLILI